MKPKTGLSTPICRVPILMNKISLKQGARVCEKTRVHYKPKAATSGTSHSLSDKIPACGPCGVDPPGLGYWFSFSYMERKTKNADEKFWTAQNFQVVPWWQKCGGDACSVQGTA